MHTIDVQLLIDAHRGHEPSARALWNNHAPRLLAFARAIVGSRTDAEDVVQAAMCRMLEVPAREIRQIRDPAAWLAQLARRTALNHLREQRRRRARDRGTRLDRSTTAPPGSDSLRSSAETSEIGELISRLPRRMREVVVLKHVGGLTFDQIAVSLDINRNTVAARHRAAVILLRRIMAPQQRSESTANTAAGITREVEHV